MVSLNTFSNYKKRVISWLYTLKPPSPTTKCLSLLSKNKSVIARENLAFIR